MADNILKGVITLDGSTFTKSIRQLEEQLKRFQNGLKDVKSVESFDRVNRSIDVTKAKLQALNNFSGGAAGGLNTFTKSTNTASFALTNLGRVAQDAPFGFIGIQNNINPLLESFQRLKSETGSTKSALKALGSSLTGAAGLGLAVSVASSLFLVFGDRLLGASKKAEVVKSEAEKLKSAIDGIFSSTAKEASQVSSFVVILQNETETRKRKLEAIKELQAIQPKVFSGLKLEGDAVIGLDGAYKNYLTSLKTVIAAKIKQAQLEQLIEKQLKLQGVTLVGLEKQLFEGNKKFIELRQKDPALDGSSRAAVKEFYDVQSRGAKELEKDISILLADLKKLSSGIPTKEINVTPDKITIDDQLSNIVKLDKPLRVSATFKVEKLFEEDSKNTRKNFDRFKDLKIFNLPIPTTVKINLSPLAKKGQEDVEKLKKSMKELGQVSLVAGQIFADAFGSLFNALAKGENAIKAFGNAFISALSQVIQKLISTAILALIVSSFGGGLGIGAASNKFGDIFKFLSFGGFRAGGGPVSGSKGYIVGENGPEWFQPGTSGSIIPNHALGSMGGRSGGGEQIFRIRGNDLVAVLAGTGRANLRLT